MIIQNAEALRKTAEGNHQQSLYERMKRQSLTTKITDRLDFVDVAKGIAILLVLLGHLLMGETWLKKSIYAFHMPFFFFAAGFFISEKPFRNYASRRIQTIIVPYMLFAFLFGTLSIKSIIPILYATNQSLKIADSNGMLWFLPSLFLSLVIVHLMRKKMRSKAIIAILSVFVFVSLGYALNQQCHGGILNIFDRWGLPLGIDIVMIGTSFSLVGYLFAYHGGLRWLGDCNKLTAAALSLLLLLVLLSVLYNTRKDYPQMATGDLGNWYVYFIVATCASIGLIALSRLISTLGRCQWLTWLGRNSLTLFLVHRMLVGILQKQVIRHSPNVLTYALSMIILCLFSVICTVIINKYFPYLVGKSSTQK